eukprot:scaffold267831_cov31-Tisochrysis_lutea.AAC.1
MLSLVSAARRRARCAGVASPLTLASTASRSSCAVSRCRSICCDSERGAPPAAEAQLEQPAAEARLEQRVPLVREAVERRVGTMVPAASRPELSASNEPARSAGVVPPSPP